MKKILSLLLIALMILSLCACGAQQDTESAAQEPVAAAEESSAETSSETEAPAEEVLPDRNEGMLSCEGNLLKITTEEDFAAGETDGLEFTPVGDGSLVLSAGVTEGTYTSAQYSSAEFTKMVASWNAFIYDGGSVEIFARARKTSAAGEEVVWTDWLTWGEFSQFMVRGTKDGKSGSGAYVDEDTFCSISGTFDGLQMQAVVRRESAEIDSPVLRLLAMTLKRMDGEAVYAEETVEIPVQSLCASPAYSQEIRAGAIADSICSPTTMTVMLNTRDPQLGLLPEEFALNSRDNLEGIFGSWSFCTSFAGNYGYESYTQYANKDILLQELAQGRPVGLSVYYSPKRGDGCPVLTGSYDSTGGHLITIIGYEYEDGIMDDDHLYLFSSDSYAPSDETSYRRYAWKEMNLCWDGRIAYIIPSLERDAVDESGKGAVVRVASTLEKAAEKNTYNVIDADGNIVDLKEIASQGGVFAYTVGGCGVDMTTDAVECDYSIIYPNAITVAANAKFFYTQKNSDGSLTLDKSAIYKEAGVSSGVITVYVITARGYMYIAEL